MKQLKKPRTCCLCRKETATLAIQVFLTSHGVPVTRRTAQVRARPQLCEGCVQQHWPEAIVTTTHARCLHAVVEVAQRHYDDPAHASKTMVLFRSQKHQPPRTVDLNRIVRTPAPAAVFAEGVDEANTAVAFNGKTIRCIDNTSVNQWIFYFSDYTYVIVHGGYYDPGYGPEIEEMGKWHEQQTTEAETTTE